MTTTAASHGGFPYGVPDGPGVQRSFCTSCIQSEEAPMRALMERQRRAWCDVVSGQCSAVYGGIDSR